MSESNKNFRDSHHRGAKNSHFASRRSDTPETGFHAQGTASPGQNTGLNSPRSPHPNNNHIQNYYNSRNPAARGRNRGEGGYHDRGNYRGYQNTGPSRVISPTNPEIPNYHELVGFMFQAWQDYSTEYYGKRGEEPPSFTNPSLSSQPPAQTSPRVSTHVNSPHRGQSYRFSHQNSSGGNWSGNSNAGVYGRKHSDNGEHSNTGSLRRHHNGHRGGNHASSPAFSSNQQWQRGNFANRQNSPNNNLNRPGGSNTNGGSDRYRQRFSYSHSRGGGSRPRHSNYHPNHRPNPTSSPAAVAGVVGSISQPIDAEQTTTTTVAEDETAQLAEEVQTLSLQRSAESPPPNNGQKKIDAMSATDQFYTPEPPSSPTNGTVDDTAAPVSPPARVKE